MKVGKKKPNFLKIDVKKAQLNHQIEESKI